MLGLTQKEKDLALNAALDEFSADQLQRAIDKGGNVNGRGGRYATPLFKAVAMYEGSSVLRAVEILLKAGANPNAVNDERQSVMQAALTGYRGDKDLIGMLIAHGADVHAQDPQQNTVLQTALQRKRWDVAEMLIGMGGHRHHTNLAGQSVLSRAIENDAPPGVVERLFDVGIDMNAGGKNAPLMLAARKGRTDYLALILKQPGVMLDVADDDKNSALMLAAESGRKEAVQALIDAKASPDYIPGRGASVLEYAAKAGHQEIVEILLKAGATMEAQGQRRVTALTNAAANGNIRMVMTMLHAAQERGVELNLAPSLAAAAENGHGRVLELLLKAGAVVDYPDSDNRTPLMKAALNDHSESLEILIKAGAAVDAQDSHGMTAYDHAVAGNRQRAKSLLNKFRSDKTATDRKSAADQGFTRVNDHSIEVREGEGLTMTFNFWTQQVIFRDTERPAPVTVQNFDDVQRQESIVEAYEKLKSLGGTPPEPRAASVHKKTALHA